MDPALHPSGFAATGTLQFQYTCHISLLFPMAKFYAMLEPLGLPEGSDLCFERHKWSGAISYIFSHVLILNYYTNFSFPSFALTYEQTCTSR